MKRAAIFKYAERKAEHFGSAINLKFMNINIFIGRNSGPANARRIQKISKNFRFLSISKI